MIELLIILLSCLVSIPVFVLFVQVVMALKTQKNTTEEATEQRPSIIVLTPAHNEELVIGETIKSVKAQLSDSDRLLVVADNCSDNTAAIARDLNAEVLERVDTDNRGKGYALNFGIDHIKMGDDKPDVLVVIDADCIVEDGSLGKLVEKCAQYDCPVQALYLMHSHSDSPGQKIAEFAWIVKNRVRPLGYSNMGLPCQLMGTGMAFPFRLLVEVSFAGSNIVEDMKLGIDMAREEHIPKFCPEACVSSAFPDEIKGIKSQRTRWEHGHLSIIFSESFGLLGTAIKTKNFSLLAMAFDLMVPPLALLAIILLVSLAITALASVFNNISGMPFLIMVIACGLFGLSVLLAWQGFARHVLSIKDLVNIPFYIFSKVPMYVQFWTRRQKDWVRTDRD